MTPYMSIIFMRFINMRTSLRPGLAVKSISIAPLESRLKCHFEKRYYRIKYKKNNETQLQ